MPVRVRAAVTEATPAGEAHKLAEHVAGRLAEVRGVRAVVLGGSFARGNADDDSDLDLGIYYRRGDSLDLDGLRELAGDLDPDHGADAVTEPGEWGRWIDGGAWLTIQGRRVDWLYRDIDRLEAVIAECRGGRFTSDYQPGHPHAFHSHMYLGEVALTRVLRDPDGVVARLKSSASPYPPRLRTAIVERFLWEARFAVDTAAKPAARGESWYVAGALFRSVACLVQVLFALNERYFLNEKGALGEIATFPHLPDRFVEIVNTVFSASGSEPDELRARLVAIGALVDASGALVDAIGDTVAAGFPGRSV